MPPEIGRSGPAKHLEKRATRRPTSHFIKPNEPEKPCDDYCALPRHYRELSEHARRCLYAGFSIRLEYPWNGV